MRLSRKTGQLADEREASRIILKGNYLTFQQEGLPSQP
jgi:hypothetical protein